MYDSFFEPAGCASRASRHRTIGTLPCPPPIRVLPAAVPLAPGVPPVLAAPVVLPGPPAGVRRGLRSPHATPAGGAAPMKRASGCRRCSRRPDSVVVAPARN